MTAPAPNLLLDDDTWDLVMTRGNLTTSSGYDAARQAVYQRLRFFKGEWYADENVGIPYWQSILARKNPDLAAIREIFRQAILVTPGIASITSIRLDWADQGARQMSLSFSAVMDDGSLLVTDGYAVGAP